MTLPPMPPTKDREPFIDVLGNDLGYTEGDADWAIENADAVTWLIDNHAAIRAALTPLTPAQEDEKFCRQYGAAVASCDYRRIAHELSGRLRQMDKRAKAANARADRLEAAAKESDLLRQHVRKFVTTQEITCAETVYQSDRVIRNAYEFIEGCCEIAGYHKHEDEA